MPPMPAAAATATPPPHTPPQPSSSSSSASKHSKPVSLLLAGGQGWSPTTFRVEVDAPAGLLLLKQQAPQQGSKGQQQQRLLLDGEENEECVAMVDLKSVGAARLCSEQEAGAGATCKGEGAKEEGEPGGTRNVVVNVEVGGKALMMRVESEAAAGELLAAVAGGKAAAILSDSAEKGSSNNNNNNGGGGSADRGARRAAAAAAAASARRRRANNSAGQGKAGAYTDPVRFLGSYTPSSPGPFQQPPPSSQTPTTPTIARVSSGSNGASPGTAAFVAERRFLQHQRQREKERVGEVEGQEEEGVEVFYKAKQGGEEGPGRPVALKEIIEKSHEAPPSPTRSVRSTHSASAPTSDSQRVLSVSDSLRSLRSGAGSEELEEGLKSLQEDHRVRSSSFHRNASQSSASSSLSPVAAGAPTAGSRAPRACCVVQ